MQELPIDIDTEALVPTQKGLDLTRLIKIIKRNIVPIASISSIVTLVFWLTNSSAPTYLGDFQLLVEPVTSEAKFSEPSTLTSSSKSGNVGSLEMDYSTVITILKSPGMLASIVEQVKPHYPDFTQKQLRENLKIARLNIDEEDLSNQTKIIEISYQDEEANLVQLVLEKTAARYLSYSLEDRKTQIGQGVEFIEEQLPYLNQRVSSLQARLQHIREQNQLIDPETKGEDLLKQLQQIKIQQLETKGELEKLKVLKQNLQRQLGMNPEEAILASTLSENSNYQKLLEKLKLLESEITTTIVLYETNSPQIITLSNKRENLVDLLNQEAKRILGEKFNARKPNSPLLRLQNSITLNMTQQLLETTNQAKLLEIQLNSLQNIQNKLEQQVKYLPKVSGQYAEVKQELAIANQTLDQLLTQRDALRIELAQSQVPWEVVSSPQLLQDASGNPMSLPQESSKKLMISLIGSLFIGIGASIIFEKSRNIFYTVEDLEEQVKFPLLGLIPSLDDRQEHFDTQVLKPSDSLDAEIEFDNKEASKCSPAISALEQENKTTERVISPLGRFRPSLGDRQEYIDNQVLDAYDSLYANIKFRFNETPIHSLTISALEQINKTTEIALYLAETVAAMGHKILLVDADFRTPSLHSRLNLPNELGLSDLLAEDTDLDSHNVIQKSVYQANLFVLTAGKSSLDSTRMLASHQMQSLNQEFTETFDLIIYDTAPLLSFMDTSFLAAHTDGIVGVVEIGKTPKCLVTKALNQIDSFNFKTLGIIATQKPKIIN